MTEQAGLLNVAENVDVVPQDPQTVTIELTDEVVERQAPPRIVVNPVPAKDVIDRATLVCRKNSAAVDMEVVQYWNGTHRMHNVNKMYGAA